MAATCSLPLCSNSNQPPNAKGLFGIMDGLTMPDITLSPLCLNIPDPQASHQLFPFYSLLFSSLLQASVTDQLSSEATYRLIGNREIFQPTCSHAHYYCRWNKREGGHKFAFLKYGFFYKISSPFCFGSSVTKLVLPNCIAICREKSSFHHT